MILASLARYYRRLAAETDDMGNPKVPPYGFSEEKIGWILVLDKEGRLKTVVPNLTADKKPQPKLMSVPQSFKRPGTTPKPFFLWDKTSYALGVEANKNKAEAKEKPFTPSEKTFEAFKQYHLEYCKTATMKASKPCAVFCKTGSLHILLPKICLPKCSMPTSHFLLKNRPHLSINAKPHKLCGQAA